MPRHWSDVILGAFVSVSRGGDVGDGVALGFFGATFSGKGWIE